MCTLFHQGTVEEEWSGWSWSNNLLSLLQQRSVPHAGGGGLLPHLQVSHSRLQLCVQHPGSGWHHRSLLHQHTVEAHTTSPSPSLGVWSFVTSVVVWLHLHGIFFIFSMMSGYASSSMSCYFEWLVFVWGYMDAYFCMLEDNLDEYCGKYHHTNTFNLQTSWNLTV